GYGGVLRREGWRALRRANNALLGMQQTAGSDRGTSAVGL
ncbi:MAG: hypothetical protein AVDCRST_MAG93-7692, partial [uncultured Chloroflexia bacterium]